MDRFKTNFPDALNILSGVISSGQSIIHAFEYVGKQLDNDVGKEFKLLWLSDYLLVKTLMMFLSVAAILFLI
ncbi:hypothetical protein O9993_18960 [Vibrio lentus]|nr:hypothetical protein [Vibrio lentus]